MIIAFSGPSGSGKTTIVRRLLGWNYLKKKDLTVKEEDNFLLVRVAEAIVGQKSFDKYKIQKFFPRERRDANSFFSKIASVLYPLAVYIEFLCDHLVYDVFAKDKILLQDRCIYDYLVTIREILGMDNLVVRLVEKLAPRPALLFSLKIGKRTSLARNKNDIVGKITADSTFHQRVLDAYAKLTSKAGAIVISTEAQTPKSLNEIKFHIECREKLGQISTIALIGLDGVGKTSLAKMICKETELVGLKCRIVHFYHENLLYKSLRRIGLWKQEGNEGASARGRLHNESRRPTNLLLAILRYADSYVQYLFSRLKNSNALLIFDRFFDDYIVHFNVSSVQGRAIFDKIVPHVSRKIMLVATPNVAFKRKPENAFEFFEASSYEYERYSKVKNIKAIDTTNKKKNEVFRNAIKLI